MLRLAGFDPFGRVNDLAGLLSSDEAKQTRPVSGPRL
jgi:hypothetical protein